VPQLNAHGLSVDTPGGWEGRIFRRPQSGEVSAASEAPGPPAPPGELTFPVLHASTIALPNDVADYASEAVVRLGPSDAIVVLKEFAPSNAGQPLFAAAGLPQSLDPEAFAPNVLQRRIRGQGGFQHFFHEAGRAFCLYVVLGAYSNRQQVVPHVNRVLASIQISPRVAP
jgi:hypothetical protein